MPAIRGSSIKNNFGDTLNSQEHVLGEQKNKREDLFLETIIEMDTIRGIVSDNLGNPLYGVVVRCIDCINKSIFAKTDIKGSFELQIKVKKILDDIGKKVTICFEYKGISHCKYPSIEYLNDIKPPKFKP